MSDASFQTLLPHLQHVQQPTLWVADENVLHAGQAIVAQPLLQVITNRYDVYRSCVERSQQAEFSDYDLGALADDSLHAVVYRISKEKPVVHHVINEAWRTLQSGGHLILSGEKNEGAKSFIDKASQLFGLKVSAQKHGNSYLGVITKHRAYDAAQRLDDKQYSEIRDIVTLGATSVCSKPGLFGWDKVDQGSQLLMDVAEAYFAKRGYPGSILDLGCGYGYLTLRTRHWPNLSHRSATDNNAAAVACAQKNFERAELEVTVTADDCGSDITEKFDAVLCNPPFHQGFSVDSALTDKFLRNSSRRLAAGGVALFVVNQFIGIEKKAADYFARCELLGSDGQFKVLALYRDH